MVGCRLELEEDEEAWRCSSIENKVLISESEESGPDDVRTPNSAIQLDVCYDDSSTASQKPKTKKTKTPGNNLLNVECSLYALSYPLQPHPNKSWSFPDLTIRIDILVGTYIARTKTKRDFDCHRALWEILRKPNWSTNITVTYQLVMDSLLGLHSLNLPTSSHA
jgi:hypothetical protein